MNNLIKEASALARKLGHSVPGWSINGNKVYGICKACHTRAVLSPRSYEMMRMTGVPVNMECVPVKRAVPAQEEELVTPSWYGFGYAGGKVTP